MRILPLLHDLAIRIKDADLMQFCALINPDKKTASNFVQWTILLE